MEISEKQINYIVSFVNTNRGMLDYLKIAFPDNLRDGANYWKSNLEKKLKYLTRETASEILDLLEDEDEQGFELLIKELNQINQ
jgi:hypothetical protein